MIRPLGTMSVHKATPGKAPASADQRTRSESPAPNRTDIASVAGARRYTHIIVALPTAQLDALDRVAPDGGGAQLAELLIHRHAPQTPRATAELILRQLDDGVPPERTETTLRLRTSLLRRFQEDVDATLAANFGHHETRRMLLIMAILAEHTPHSPAEGRAVWWAERAARWCAQRAAIRTRDPARAQTALGDELSVVVTVYVPGALARCVELARFELSAARPPALGTHLLSALIWAHADPADQDGFDALMGHLVAYEGAVARAGVNPGVWFRVPESLRDRLHAIAGAAYWRTLRPGTLAATLLWTHTETSSGDPEMFGHMLRTCEDYTAAARVGPRDAALP
jgi:hypothetical protein